jgi:hypothetical protein
MKYFRITDRFEQNGRWWLGAPKTRSGIELDPRLFTEGKEYRGQTTYPEAADEKKLISGKDYGISAPFEIAISRAGNPLSFTLASFDMPVVSERIAEHLQSYCGNFIQLLPAVISGNHGRFEILNVVRTVDAIDEEHSEISWWTEEDGLPLKTGSYAGIARLTLSGDKIMGSPIFRLREWESPLIVAERVKNILESLHSTGIAFKELTVK